VSNLVQALSTRLLDFGLEPSDLDAPGAHVLISDDQSRLHLLIREGKASAQIDKLEAQLGPKSVKVTESASRLDLGTLGKWRDFVVEGVGAETPPGTPEAPVELAIYSAASKAGAVGSAFYTSLDLGFAIGEVILGESLAVRPIPAGERSGKSFVGIDPKLKGLVKQLLGRWVDDTVPAETLARTMDRWRDLQSSVVESGLIGAALSLGLVPSSIPKPIFTSAAKPEGSKQSALSEGARSWLVEHGIDPPAAPKASWLEEVIDGLPAAAPESVAGELRELYVLLSQKEEAAVDDLFGGLVETERKAELKVTAGAGATKLAKSKALKVAQLSAGLDGLGVDESTVRALADLLAGSLQPSAKPSVVIVAGPEHSAADRMFEIASGLVGKKPLELGREDLAQPGFPGVYGNIKGVPTQADAILAEGRLAKHRETAASFVPIVVPDLGAVGSLEIDQDARRATLEDWLERVREMTRTGKVNLYAKENMGSSELHTVSLANTVFLMRWRGGGKDLRELLAANEDLAPLSARIVETTELKPEHALRYLEQRLSSRLVEQGLPKQVKVSIGADLRTGLKKAYEALGSRAAYEAFAERLSEELVEAATAVPSAEYTIHWSKQLTKKERERVLGEEAIPFAARYYSIEAKA
jgi:hypothetical protein